MAVEVLFEKSDSKKKKRYLALVEHVAKPKEQAIVTLNKKTHVLLDIFPINKNFQVESVPGGFSFKFENSATEGHSGGTRRYLCSDEEKLKTLDAFASSVHVALAVAKRENFKPGTSHQWIEKYRSVAKHEQLPDMIPDTKEEEPSNDDPLDDWIHSQLKIRANQFTTYSDLRIFLGTWNVNGRKPTDALEPWLCELAELPHLFCIGLQELDLSAENFLLGSSALEGLWVDHIDRTLKSLSSSFVLVASKRLVGILLLVFVQEEFKSRIGEIESGMVPVGVMGVMGNKGAVAIRFRWEESWVCVVNAHLPPHAENVQRRNECVHTIQRRLTFSPSGTPSTIDDHEYVFWLGDLNYRVDLPPEQVRELIQREDWQGLVSKDQLETLRRRGEIFGNYSEGPLTFAPSYKFEPGTNEYTSSETKPRTPSYCDRILWKSIETSLGNDFYPNLEMKEYGMVSKVVHSDHRPVRGIYLVRTKRVIPSALRKVRSDLNEELSQIHKELDRIENSHRPAVSISWKQNGKTIEGGEINCGVIPYLTPVTQTLYIHNTGIVPAFFSFIPKYGHDEVCSPWLQIHPMRGRLEKGERCSVKFTIFVDQSTALSLNFGLSQLEEIVILHLDGGVDFFVTVTGTFQPTCFGNTLKQLVRFPGPIRTTKPKSDRSRDVLDIPKELWYLVDFLYRNAMDEEELFLQTGDDAQIRAIRECLDTSERLENNNFSNHSVAEALLSFLRDLGEPVVPYVLYPLALRCEDLSQCKSLVSQFDPVHYNTFYYLMSFLREVLNHSEENKLKPEHLAGAFGSVLLQSENFEEVTSGTKQQIRFILSFLTQ